MTDLDLRDRDVDIDAVLTAIYAQPDYPTALIITPDQERAFINEWTEAGHDNAPKAITHLWGQPVRVEERSD